MEKPGFLRNNEEWIVWLLADEPESSSTPEDIAKNTALPLDQVHDNFLYLERVKAISLRRDPLQHYPNEITLITLTDEGKKIYDELKERPDLGDDDIF